LFQTRDDARKALVLFDPSLNKPIVERVYAVHCEFTLTNMIPAINDRYFIAHFVGWVIKSLMIRDQVVCWVISISWELIEIVFTHWLPNFAECWWDQWILDVLICNGLGIYVGHKLCNYLEVRRYKWSGVRDLTTVWGKFQRVLLQFTPERWTKVSWAYTSSFGRFVTLHVIVIFFQLEELNAFFLKHILWVPPESYLNMVRLAIWSAITLPSTRQVYAYITDPKCKRIGNQTFLIFIILATEFLIIVKFGKGMFTTPMPDSVYDGLLAALCVYAIFFCFVLRSILARRHEDPSKKVD